MNLAKSILEYEINFNNGFKMGYKSDEEFLNDLNKEIKTNGVSDLIECYKTFSKSMRDTNSTNEKREAIQDLIWLMYQV